MFEVNGIAYGSHTTFRKNVKLVVCADTEDEVRLIIANEFPVRIEITSIKVVVGKVYYVVS